MLLVLRVPAQTEVAAKGSCDRIQPIVVIPGVDARMSWIPPFLCCRRDGPVMFGWPSIGNGNPGAKNEWNEMLLDPVACAFSNP